MDGRNLTGLRWRKGSRSTSGEGMDCVEVAALGGAVVARDSKDRGGPVLHFEGPEWTAFLRGVKRGN